MIGILALLVVAGVVFFRIRHLLPVDMLKLGLSMLQVRKRHRHREGHLFLLTSRVCGG